MRNISRLDCDDANTGYCYIRDNCAPGKALVAVCNEPADGEEVRNFLKKIGALNASQPLWLSVSAQQTFYLETYAPVADMLVSLTIAWTDDFNMSMIHALRLPILTQIKIRYCTNVVIERKDFRFFARLTSLWIEDSTVARIEQGAFDVLPLLRQISFDKGIPLSTTMTSAQKEHLRLLHCDCRYKWLREYLAQNPNLIAGKKDEDVLNIGGIHASRATIRDLYAPIDCSKDDLIGEMWQIPFSVNDPCS